MLQAASSRLEPFRAEAERHYASAEYRHQVRELHDGIQSIRGKIIAVDLEGTLVCRSLRATYGQGRPQSPSGIKWAEKVGPIDRLRRPFANELLQALSASSNGAFIWTGAEQEDARAMLNSAKITFPPNVAVISRDQYVPILLQSGAFKAAEAMCARPTQRFGEGLLKVIRRGDFKLLPVLGADALIDDHARGDENLCAQLFGDQKYGKFVHVSEFRIDTIHDLERHSRDTGLLDAVRTMAAR